MKRELNKSEINLKIEQSHSVELRLVNGLLPLFWLDGGEELKTMEGGG